jgi:hypothetical protein
MQPYDSLSDAQKEFLRKSAAFMQESGNISLELNRWGGLWSVIGKPHGGGFECPGAQAGMTRIDFSFFEELADHGLIQLERLSGRSWKCTLSPDLPANGD